MRPSVAVDPGGTSEEEPVRLPQPRAQALERARGLTEDSPNPLQEAPGVGGEYRKEALLDLPAEALKPASNTPDALGFPQAEASRPSRGPSLFERRLHLVQGGVLVRAKIGRQQPVGHPATPTHQSKHKDPLASHVARLQRMSPKPATAPR